MAITGGALVGASATMALHQAFQLRDQWKKTYHQKAKACQGPTEGLELRQPAAPSEEAAFLSSEEAAPPPTTLLLFLGDSLVSGVGGQADCEDGSSSTLPALPQNVAACLAEHAGGRVRWASVGITGADVKRLSSEGLPQLKEKISLSLHKEANAIVVVLVVGVNDLRKLQLVTYRLRLRSLVHELRNLRCDDGRAVDAVVLPALRLYDAPLLQHFPLRYFLVPVFVLWEREKRKAITWFKEADAMVLPFPAPPSGSSIGAFFSADQIHPSPIGYAWWAQSLARQIHGLLNQRGVESLAHEAARDFFGLMPLVSMTRTA
jgi:lysophospholipase L1-like esterase